MSRRLLILAALTLGLTVGLRSTLGTSAQPLPPTAQPPPTVIVATPVTGPNSPGTGKHKKHHRRAWYTIFANNGQAGWTEPVDRKPAPRGFRGWHVCGSRLASRYPFCVPRYWKRGGETIHGFRFDWLWWPAPPKPPMPALYLPDNLAGWRYIIVSAAQQTGVPAAIIAGVMEGESGGDPNATSYSGAMGLMQLLPSTAASFGVSNPYDPWENTLGGARVLVYLLRSYGGGWWTALTWYSGGGPAVSGGYADAAMSRAYAYGYRG